MMVGQVFYSFMEQIITHVFERDPEEVHVYEFDEMFEVFEKKGSFAFETDTQRLRAIDRWQKLQKKIGWTENDQASYQYIEKLSCGFAEKRLTVHELQMSLDCAKIKRLLCDHDTNKLQRFIDILEILSNYSV